MAFTFILLFIPALASAAVPTSENPFIPCIQDSLEPDVPVITEQGVFQTSLYTGSGTYAYSIDLPPGTNELAPELVLSYNSHNAKDRSSWAGAGWSLTGSYIQRDVNSTPDDPADDTFDLILNGQQYPLVLTPSDGRYHTEEESYLFVEKLAGSPLNEKGEYWLVKSPGGLQYRFGYTIDAETVMSTRDAVWRWSLDEVVDTFGNHIYYSYTENPTVKDIGAVYPARIEYNNDKKRVVEFILEATDRPDMATVYNNGNKMRIARRLAEIRITADGNLVSTYRLTYEANDPSTLSFISQIDRIGADGISSLPPVTFEYEELGIGWVQDTTWKAPTYLGGAKGYIVVDVNCDGFPDILRGYKYYDPTLPYPYEKFLNDSWINTGNGWVHDNTWAPPIEFCYYKTDDGRFWDDAWVQDMNGDGRPDIFAVITDTLINTGNGWETNTSWRLSVSPQGQKGWRFTDVNGDGLVDLIRGYMYYDRDKPYPYEYFVNDAYINTGNGWVHDTRWAPPVPFVYEDFYYDRFNEYYEMTDLNGDGLPDIFLPSSTATYLNNGTGWEYTNEWRHPFTFQSRIGSRFIDVNGDGLSDMIRADMEYEDGVEDFHVQAYINTGDGWVSDSRWYAPYPFVYRHEDGRSWARAIPMDANGDGQSDIIHALEAWVHAGEGHACRLIQVNNGIGGTIAIDYMPTSDLPDSEIGFVMQCVKSTTKENGISGVQGISAQESMLYEEGFFDHINQEFRGFGRVIVTDALDQQQIHYFCQDDALKGKEYKTEVYDDAGSIYQATEQTWHYEVDGGVFVTHLDESRMSLYDGRETGPKVTAVSYDYDEYGNTIVQAMQGDNAVSGDEKTSVTEYTYNPAAWIVNRPKHMTLLEADGLTKAAEAWYYYDGHTTPDTPPTQGAVTRKEVWLDTGANPVTTYSYDSYGNPVSITDANGQRETYEYGITDPTFTFQELTTNALGHPTRYSYDLGTGNILRVIDPNGFATRYAYDVFGRIMQVIRPGDSTGYPTVTYDYLLDGVAPESILTSRRETSGQSGTLDSITHYDGMGQSIQTRTDAEDTSRAIVASTLYDKLGRVAEQTVPYDESAGWTYAQPPSVRSTSYVYDALGRTVVTKNPDETQRTTTYDHWLEIETDENGNQVEIRKDAYDRTVRVREFMPSSTFTTDYTYDTLDNLLSITDTEGNQFRYSYDTLGRKIEEIDPDMGRWQYGYDANGNLISQTDARGRKTSITYDPLNRAIYKDYPVDNDVTYVYDSGTIGPLSEMSNGISTTHYTYDSRLRSIREEQEVDGRVWVTEREYDSADRPTAIRYPTGEVTDYQYNNQGLLDAVSGIVDAFDYNNDGNIIRKDFANGVSTTLAYYETNHRLESISTAGLQDLTYSYDPVGNVIGILDGIFGMDQTFSYDALNRLITAYQPAGYQMCEYAYDSIGNIIRITRPDGDAVLTYGGAGPHAVTGREKNTLPGISLTPADATTSVGYNAAYVIILDDVPSGLSSYNCTLQITNGTVAGFSGTEFPGWAGNPNNSSLPAQSLWIRGEDTGNSILPGERDVLLGTVFIEGSEVGSTGIIFTSIEIIDDSGADVSLIAAGGQLVVLGVMPFPGTTNPPLDPDQDGLFEDVNGDGVFSFGDVRTFFEYYDVWTPANEPVECFDYDNNTVIGFGDVRALFWEWGT